MSKIMEVDINNVNINVNYFLFLDLLLEVNDYLL